MVFVFVQVCSVFADTLEKAKEYNLLGDKYSEQGKYQQAIKEYEKAISIASDYAQSYYNLGVIYNFKLNDNGKAIFYYKKYLELEKYPLGIVNTWLNNAVEDLKKEKISQKKKMRKISYNKRLTGNVKIYEIEKTVLIKKSNMPDILKEEVEEMKRTFIEEKKEERYELRKEHKEALRNFNEDRRDELDDLEDKHTDERNDLKEDYEDDNDDEAYTIELESLKEEQREETDELSEEHEEEKEDLKEDQKEEIEELQEQQKDEQGELKEEIKDFISDYFKEKIIQDMIVETLNKALKEVGLQLNIEQARIILNENDDFISNYEIVDELINEKSVKVKLEVSINLTVLKETLNSMGYSYTVKNIILKFSSDLENIDIKQKVVDILSNSKFVHSHNIERKRRREVVVSCALYTTLKNFSDEVIEMVFDDFDIAIKSIGDEYILFEIL